MQHTTRLITVFVALMGCTRSLALEQTTPAAIRTPSSLSLLSLPPGDRPVVVRAGIEIQNINEIDDGTETFEFSAVLTLVWNDPRQAFDANVDGPERVFQGNFQFDELSPGWYPQLVLVNASGSPTFDGVTLRVKADGTATLIQKLGAVAEVPFDMRVYPFDSQRLEAIFEVLGFSHDEVELQLLSNAVSEHRLHVPQWKQTAVSQTIIERAAPHLGKAGTSSAFVAAVELQREPFFVLRLVILPLFVIVLLSFAVFWMEQASLGDRLSVSFIGILTAVAYQMVISDSLPPISYVTLTHGFLSMSFVMMAATVVINLFVAVIDRRGQREVGDRIDRRCRWLFPLVYFALILATVYVARFIL